MTDQILIHSNITSIHTCTRNVTNLRWELGSSDLLTVPSEQATRQQGCPVLLTVHVPLVLILDECIAPWLAVHCIVGHHNLKHAI